MGFSTPRDSISFDHSLTSRRCIPFAVHSDFVFFSVRHRAAIYKFSS